MGEHDPKRKGSEHSRPSSYATHVDPVSIHRTKHDPSPSGIEKEKNHQHERKKKKNSNENHDRRGSERTVGDPCPSIRTNGIHRDRWRKGETYTIPSVNDASFAHPSARCTDGRTSDGSSQVEIARCRKRSRRAGLERASLFHSCTGAVAIDRRTTNTFRRHVSTKKVHQDPSSSLPRFLHVVRLFDEDLFSSPTCPHSTTSGFRIVSEQRRPGHEVVPPPRWTVDIDFGRGDARHSDPPRPIVVNPPSRLDESRRKNPVFGSGNRRPSDQSSFRIASEAVGMVQSIETPIHMAGTQEHAIGDRRSSLHDHEREWRSTSPTTNEGETKSNPTRRIVSVCLCSGRSWIWSLAIREIKRKGQQWEPTTERQR